MKESSNDLRRLNDYIETCVMNKFDEGDYPYIDVVFRVNDRKLETGSLSMIANFNIVSETASFKKNIDFVMTYNAKMNMYNLTVLDGEHDGFKVLYCNTSPTVDEIIESSKAYLGTIIHKAVEKVSWKYFNFQPQ